MSSEEKRALVLMAEGNEDVEVTIPTYVFRYGGVKTLIASVSGEEIVTLDQEIKVKADLSLEEALKSAPFDVVFLPGGIRGAPNLAENKLVGELLKIQERSNGVVGAICYSPALSLTKYKVYCGRRITCYPKQSVKEVIFSAKTHSFVDEGVVEDGPLLTAQGPGFAVDISLAIVRRLSGEAKAEEVSRMMLLHKRQ